MRRFLLIFFLGSCLLFAACGGGSTGDQHAFSGGDPPSADGEPAADDAVAPPDNDPEPAESAVVIDVHPVDQNVILGQSAVFTVSASGPTPLAYQWQRDGRAIAGATQAQYATATLALADNGAQFTVRVSHLGSESVSRPARLRVYAEAAIPEPTAYDIDPVATDAAIDPGYGDFVACINPAVSPKGKLFIFFPGTDAKPQHYRLIIQAAADNGYHALGLAYPNSRPVSALCLDTLDDECPGAVHDEALTGRDASTEISVSAADSIDNRLRKALLYLSRQFPADGWATFLNNDRTIRWPLLRVAGHSQGGATAGYIGKRHAVDRVIFFSAPYEKVSNETPAWLTDPAQTAPQGFFGFSHLRDGMVPWHVIEESWPALRMDIFGGFAAVDGNVPPYGGSHMLYTDFDDRKIFLFDALAYHNITVLDFETPIEESTGLPIFRHIWQYLCFS